MQNVPYFAEYEETQENLLRKTRTFFATVLTECKSQMNIH